MRATSVQKKRSLVERLQSGEAVDAKCGLWQASSEDSFRQHTLDVTGRPSATEECDQCAAGAPSSATNLNEKAHVTRRNPSVHIKPWRHNLPKCTLIAGEGFLPRFPDCQPPHSI